MLSPRKAPTAPQTITIHSEYGASPVLTATPAMMTVVSLGTIGMIESKKAIAKTAPRNHQFDAQSPSASVRSVTQLKIPASMTSQG